LATKEATARIKINRLLEEAGWRFFDSDKGPANIVLEPNIKLKPDDLASLGEDLEKSSNGYVDFLLLDARGKPLIILEAKSESKNPLSGKEQAKKAALTGIPARESRLGEALYEVMTGQSIMLMAGLLVIGFISTMFMDPKGFQPFYDFFQSKGMLFRGLLCIFLLEMGLVAGERLGDLVKVGPFLVAFGILMPLFHGFLGVWLGHLAGLNLGGCTVLGAIVASASYIAAPPAVRLTLPEANPTLSITAALAITFPFNIAFGIPIYFEMAKWVGAQ
jgi:hypothetical protein